jgi:putative addiction module component (TIGR02574 family)
MSAAELLEKAKALPIEERAELLSQLEENLAEEGYDFDSDLSPEQVAELDRRAERALSNPEQCRPLEDVISEIEERSRTRK